MSGQAVVVIDVQKAILDVPGLQRPVETRAALDAVVGCIAQLLARARERGVPVLYVQHNGGPGHRLEAGLEGWEIRAEIAPLPGEPVIHKRACDAFFETTLDAELRRQGVDELIICGCMTQWCVDTSVRRAVSIGYQVLLASDAHTTTDFGDLRFEQIVAHHNAALNGVGAGSRVVRVVPSADALAG